MSTPRTASRLAATATLAVVGGTVAVLTGDPVAALVAGIASVATAVLSWQAARGAEAVTVIELPSVETAPAASSPVDRTASRRLPVSPAGVVDPDGLMNEAFLAETLRGRVAVARRALRPLSVVYFEVLELDPAGGKRPVAAAQVADVLRTTLREADVAGRAADGALLFVLEDTGEDGAVWTAERLRRTFAEVDPGRRFRAGVASYPSHGLEPEELRAKARSALESAREWTGDRIEIAPSG